MAHDETLRRLQNENDRLKRRVVEIEEEAVGRPDAAKPAAELEAARADRARLLKLLSQKDKILENYVAEIERKGERSKTQSDALRQAKEAAAQAGARASLAAAALNLAAGAVVVVDAAGRLIHATPAARAQLGSAAFGPDVTDAAAALGGLDPGLADDLRAALGGAEPAARTVTAGGKTVAARVIPVRGESGVIGAVVTANEK